MKLHYLITLLLVSVDSLGQDSKTLEPTVGEVLDFSPEFIEKFNSEESLEKCKRVWEKMEKEGRRYEDINPEEKEILKYCDEIRENIWDIDGGGCSWYCGGGPMNITASSFLSTQGNNSYSAENAHDLNYKNAWVEGVPGYGIGEYLEYIFAPESPRINEIIVVNGYVKSKSAWENNSRVKVLKMYLNDKPFAYMNLKDVRAVQHFKIPAVGNSDRSDLEALKKEELWKIKFEIVDVYKGKKYDDVVITEIYFDGLDVHCLAKGTKITMADSTYKNIELLSVGDEILSYNTGKDKFEPSVIKELANPVHDNLIKISFKNGGSITATTDHPFFDGTHWRSFDPQKTTLDYQFDHVNQLERGAKLQTFKGWVEIKSIELLDSYLQTYTIVELERNKSFIANDVIVGTEALRVSPNGINQSQGTPLEKVTE